MIEVGFQEVEIQTTMLVLLWRWKHDKIPLPAEVELCLPGMEIEGWRAAAIRTLKEGNQQRMIRETIILH